MFTSLLLTSATVFCGCNQYHLNCDDIFSMRFDFINSILLFGSVTDWISLLILFLLFFLLGRPSSKYTFEGNFLIVISRIVIGLPVSKCLFTVQPLQHSADLCEYVLTVTGCATGTIDCYSSVLPDITCLCR